MEIISVSMDKGQLEKLEKIQQELKFRSRSRLLRAAIDSMLNEFNVLDAKKGHTDAVFTVTHASHGTDSLGRLLDEFEDVIKTEVHQHHENVCLRVLIACGNATRVKELFSHLKRRKGIRSVQVSVL